MIAASPNVPILTPPQVPVPDEYPFCGVADDHKAMAMDLKGRLSKIYESLSGEASLGEKEWADDACLLRYLRASKWDVDAAEKRLANTLQWRRDYRPNEIPPEEVEPEAVTGKEFISGFDLHGRPIIYLSPRLENTKTYERQLRFVVFNLEKGVAVMPKGVEQFTLVIDFEGISMMNSTPTSVSIKFLQTLGDHYPERLGKGFMVNPTWYLWVFFKLIGAFLDPVTKSKIHFVNVSKQKALNEAAGAKDGKEVKEGKEEKGTGGWTNILNFIAADQLPARFGGTHEFEYDHETYWKHFLKV
ncbi:hypothetical protein HDV05_007001 [Chytridiales sp. JEL 0842]|nr:hypothetical protein HDV05_007001 [Chytridiales sp. JEL 0842]